MRKARLIWTLLLLYAFIATHHILEREKEKDCVIRPPFVYIYEHMLEGNQGPIAKAIFDNLILPLHLF